MNRRNTKRARALQVADQIDRLLEIVVYPLSFFLIGLFCGYAWAYRALIGG